MTRSVYENRDYGWRAKLAKLIRREKPAQVVIGEGGSPTFVVGAGRESGRIVGLLCEDGSMLRFPEPPSDDPSTWPRDWWQPVIGGDDPWS